jgi:hypothetical protein
MQQPELRARLEQIDEALRYQRAQIEQRETSLQQSLSAQAISQTTIDPFSHISASPATARAIASTNVAEQLRTEVASLQAKDPVMNTQYKDAREFEPEPVVVDRQGYMWKLHGRIRKQWKVGR